MNLMIIHVICLYSYAVHTKWFPALLMKTSLNLRLNKDMYEFMFKNLCGNLTLCMGHEQIIRFKNS